LATPPEQGPQVVRIIFFIAGNPAGAKSFGCRRDENIFNRGAAVLEIIFFIFSNNDNTHRRPHDKPSIIGCQGDGFQHVLIGNGCRLFAEGAKRPASISFFSTSSATGFSRKDRQLFRFLMA